MFEVEGFIKFFANPDPHVIITLRAAIGGFILNQEYRVICEFIFSKVLGINHERVVKICRSTR